jgi:DNA-binding transcriptional regulator YdaS (Cro superfamily)
MSDVSLRDLVEGEAARRACLLGEIAAEVGVSQGTLSRWMAGHFRPHPRLWRALGQALHVTPPELRAAIECTRIRGTQPRTGAEASA